MHRLFSDTVNFCKKLAVRIRIWLLLYDLRRVSYVFASVRCSVTSLLDLRRNTWSPMNRFRTGQGPCRANLHKWGLAQSPSCDCAQRQTVNQIVDMRPLTKFEGGLNLLHEANDDAVIWLESTATAALAK